MLINTFECSKLLFMYKILVRVKFVVWKLRLFTLTFDYEMLFSGFHFPSQLWSFWEGTPAMWVNRSHPLNSRQQQQQQRNPFRHLLKFLSPDEPFVTRVPFVHRISALPTNYYCKLCHGICILNRREFLNYFPAALDPKRTSFSTRIFDCTANLLIT